MKILGFNAVVRRGRVIYIVCHMCFSDRWLLLVTTCLN
jgi:hypothetical protein